MKKTHKVMKKLLRFYQDYNYDRFTILSDMANCLIFLIFVLQKIKSINR